MEKKQFPEKWYILITDENIHVLQAWRDEQAKKTASQYTTDYINYTLTNSKYVVSKHKDDNSYAYATNIKDNPSYNDYTEIAFDEFEKYVLKKPIDIDMRFPFKLTEENAKRIYNSACSSWQKILCEAWAKDIFRYGYTTIFVDKYKEMRKACTPAQDTIFDEIFGKDVAVDFSILNDIDTFYIKDTMGSEALIKYKCVDGLNEKVYNMYDKGIIYKKQIHTVYIDDIRSLIVKIHKATKRERNLFNIVHSPYKKGDWIITKGFDPKYDGKPLQINEICICPDDYGIMYTFDGKYFTYDHIERYATEDEVPRICPYEDGELIFVRDYLTCEWLVKKSNGTFNNVGHAVTYLSQSMSNSKSYVTCSWTYHAPFAKELPK